MEVDLQINNPELVRLVAPGAAHPEVVSHFDGAIQVMKRQISINDFVFQVKKIYQTVLSLR
jgi:hypothetical protein